MTIQVSLSGATLSTMPSGKGVLQAGQGPGHRRERRAQISFAGSVIVPQLLPSFFCKLVDYQEPPPQAQSWGEDSGGGFVWLNSPNSSWSCHHGNLDEVTSIIKMGEKNFFSLSQSECPLGSSGFCVGVRTVGSLRGETSPLMPRMLAVQTQAICLPEIFQASVLA